MPGSFRPTGAVTMPRPTGDDKSCGTSRSPKSERIRVRGAHADTSLNKDQQGRGCRGTMFANAQADYSTNVLI